VVTPPVRERILDAAETRFFRDGIAVTAVDQIAGSADVAIATLYKHFGSKDNLLHEVLSRRLTSWNLHWDAAVAAATSDEDRLLAVFDAVDTFRAAAGPTQWCCFLATASERPQVVGGRSDPVLELVEEDTRRIVERLERLAGQAGCADPSTTAAELLLLYNGVLSSLLRGLPAEPATAARRLAAELLAVRLRRSRP
jgi:AcrR family transcriptional regulator